MKKVPVYMLIIGALFMVGWCGENSFVDKDDKEFVITSL
ncbi:hypothetical protein HNR27_002690 [Ornithinibacillus bavariensis]